MTLSLIVPDILRSEEYMADDPEPDPGHEHKLEPEPGIGPEHKPEPEPEPKVEQEFKTSKLLELASSIQAQVSQIQKHLTKTNQSNPQFESSSPLTNWDGIDDTRSACLENLTQLQDLLMTPREILHTQAVSPHQTKRQTGYVCTT